MVDQLFRRRLRIIGVPHEIDGFLVSADIPQLDRVSQSLDDQLLMTAVVGRETLTPSHAKIKNSSMSGCMTVSVV